MNKQNNTEKVEKLWFMCTECKNEFRAEELKKLQDTELAVYVLQDRICPNCGAYTFTIYTAEEKI